MEKCKGSQHSADIQTANVEKKPFSTNEFSSTGLLFKAITTENYFVINIE